MARNSTEFFGLEFSISRKIDFFFRKTLNFFNSCKKLWQKGLEKSLIFLFVSFSSDFPTIFDAGERLEKISNINQSKQPFFDIPLSSSSLKSRVELCYGIGFVFPNPKSDECCLFRQFHAKKVFFHRKNSSDTNLFTTLAHVDYLFTSYCSVCAYKT